MKKNIALIIVTSLITLSITLLLITILSHSSNKKDVKNTNITDRTVEIEKQNLKKEVFTKEDRKIAKEIANKYIVLLTEFHGEIAQTSEEHKTIKQMMNQKADKLGILHENVYIISPTLIVRDANDVLIFRMENFKLGNEFTTKYYEHINIHELTLPCIYITPKNNEINYDFKFVKTLDGEIKIVDGLLINGINFESMDEEAYYDEYFRSEMQQRAKEELKVQ